MSAHHAGIVGRSHPVAAEEVELPGDDPGHGHARVTVDGRQQSDLHLAASTTQAEDGVGAGLLAADGVDRDVAAAAGEVGDSGRDVDAVGKQGVLSAESGCDSEGLGVAVHRDHAGAERAGDHHRR